MSREIESDVEQNKVRIVVVDDEPQLLDLLCLMLARSGNEVIPFIDSAAALAAILAQPPDMILLDVTMPGMDGIQLCEKIKEHPELKYIPIIFLSALSTTENKIRGFRAGGVDYITKPYQFDEVQVRIGTHLRLNRAETLLRQQKDILELAVQERTTELQLDIEMRKRVEAELEQQIDATEEAFNYTVHALARAAEANDEDTGNHILRVGEFSAIIASELGLDNVFVEAIRLQAILHDVGKIHTPPDIFKKPGKLTDEEFAVMKTHTVAGTTIIGENDKLNIGCRIALTHHERWDGSGYPGRLAGVQIPVEGRIVAIADIYDALRSHRPYKEAFDHDKTYKIITEGDGRTMPAHFDPAVLEAFKKTAARIKTVYEAMRG